jgi:hypothetical protein
MILNPGRNIFGDNSLKRFAFTLKNPHNISANRSDLKPEQKNQSITCDSGFGLCFCDIGIYSDCNTNTDSSRNLGYSHTNDTGFVISPSQ